MKIMNYLLWQMYIKIQFISIIIEDNYRYGHIKVVIVLHSVINDCIKTSLVQDRY